MIGNPPPIIRTKVDEGGNQITIPTYCGECKREVKPNEALYYCIMSTAWECWQCHKAHYIYTQIASAHLIDFQEEI